MSWVNTSIGCKFLAYFEMVTATVWWKKHASNGSDAFNLHIHFYLRYMRYNYYVHIRALQDSENIYLYYIYIYIFGMCTLCQLLLVAFWHSTSLLNAFDVELFDLDRFLPQRVDDPATSPSMRGVTLDIIYSKKMWDACWGPNQKQKLDTRTRITTNNNINNNNGLMDPFVEN